MCRAGLIAVEKGFTYQGKPYRADIIVHDRQGKPALMVECKAPEVSISTGGFDQVATYNQVIRAQLPLCDEWFTAFLFKNRLEPADLRVHFLRARL